MNNQATGKLITIDGIDGGGKTTQVKRLEAFLIQRGIVPYVTREPGGTVLSERIRELLLSTEHTMSVTTELLLMFAARAEHIESVLRPKIEAGQWVICSRFTDATLAYQGYARGVNIDHIRQIANVVHGNFNPDLSLFLDLPAELAAQRRNQRGEAADRIEAEDLAFMKAVRQGYLCIAEAEPKRCQVIDATQDINAVSDAINHIVATMLN